MQVCWLTKKGRDFLVDGGHAAAADLFPSSGVVPAKDFAHTVEIVNAALAMHRRVPAPDELLPAASSMTPTRSTSATRGCASTLSATSACLTPI